jgi:hypothetical protein
MPRDPRGIGSKRASETTRRRGVPMTRNHLIAAALSLLLAGCVSVKVGPEEGIKIGDTTITMSGLEGFNAAAVRTPDPNYVLVFVNASAGIVVDQEPVRPLRPSGGTVSITWALDAESAYAFPDDRAISFTAGEGNPLPGRFACAVRQPKRKSITCAYDKPGRPQQWKYAIRVIDRAGTELARLDPWVHQP